MSRKTFYITFSLIIGLSVGLGIAARFDFMPKVETQPQSLPIERIRGDFEEAVVRVAETAGKAVVSISTERLQRRGGRRGLYFGSPFEDFFGGDDFFRRFFEDFFGDMPEREFRQRGLGSGVIIDAAGYILTNEHVIAEADTITVTLPDGRKFSAEIKGKDTRSDLAVIKINAANLPAARLGDSDELRIGDWVVAIGNPFGFALENPEPTVTAGVVSALHRALGRSLTGGRFYDDLIQTDAAINPGNSGGPLVNLNGEIVGINVAIITTTGGFHGLGFAIPINQAKRILANLIAGREVLYGWLGVSIQDLTPELSGHFGLDHTKGALVSSVLEDSPAQKAGIKEGDIILKFGAETIRNVRHLMSVVAQTQVGKKETIIAWRDKKEISLSVEIGQRPQEISEAAIIREFSWRGLEVEEVTPELMRRYGLSQESGVVIVDINPGSPAEQAGLIIGDVMQEINRAPIRSLSDFKRITQETKGDALIRTQKGFFVLKPEDE